MMTDYEKGCKFLGQLEDLCVRLEYGYATQACVIVLARAIWWLLAQWCKDHPPKKKV